MVNLSTEASWLGVGSSDFGSADPLAGVAFQEIWERKAYQFGRPGYEAPAQRVGISCADCPPPRAWLIGAPIVRMFSLGICGRPCPIMLPIPWRWRFPRWIGNSMALLHQML